MASGFKYGKIIFVLLNEIITVYIKLIFIDIRGSRL